jgi:hypothetical protein
MFGIQRTTGIFFPMIFSIDAVVTPAAIEMTNWFLCIVL